MDKYGVVTPLWARSSKLPSIDNVLRHEYETKYSFGQTPGLRYRQARKFAIATRAAYSRMWGALSINISANLTGFRDALLQAQGGVEALAKDIGGVKYYPLRGTTMEEPLGVIAFEKPVNREEIERFRATWEARRQAGSLLSTLVL